MALGLPPAQCANGITPQKGGIKPRSNQSRSVADMVIFNFIGAAFRITSSYHARSYACGGRSGGAVNCQDLPKTEQCKTAEERVMGRHGCLNIRRAYADKRRLPVLQHSIKDVLVGQRKVNIGPQRTGSDKRRADERIPLLD